ncbi:hypothetical protein MCEGEM3_00800 [Oxalobacteraceae bacterium]|jgi:hypothetical protein
MQALAAERGIVRWIPSGGVKAVEPYAFHFNPQEPDFFEGRLHTEPDAGTAQATAT